MRRHEKAREDTRRHEKTREDREMRNKEEMVETSNAMPMSAIREVMHPGHTHL